MGARRTVLRIVMFRKLPIARLATIWGQSFLGTWLRVRPSPRAGMPSTMAAATMIVPPYGATISGPEAGPVTSRPEGRSCSASTLALLRAWNLAMPLCDNPERACAPSQGTLK